jgi:plastocyanin
MHARNDTVRCSRYNRMMYRYGIIVGVLLSALPTFAFAHYVEMRVTEDGFEPKKLEIYPGESVFFVNDDTRPHWIASDDHPTHTVYPGSDIRLCGSKNADAIFDSCRGLAPGEVYDFTFTKPGTWHLHDHLDSAVRATVVVLGDSAADESAEEESHWGPTLSPAGRTLAFLQRVFYSLFPSAGEQRLHDLNSIEISKSDANLEYWMRVFGYKAMFDELVRDAFDPAQRSQTPDDQNKVTQCHVEAHFSGRMAYRLYGFDTLTESILDTRCAFGFYHGIIEMALGTEGSDAKASDFTRQCEQYGSDPIRRAFCYHAVGHGLMVYYDFDVPKAIQKCAEFSQTTAGKRMCYHGAFMENAFAVAGVGVSGHTSGWSDPERPDFPCSSELLPDDPDVLRMCYVDQSFIWWSHRGGVDVETAVSGCERAPESAREGCYRGVGFNMSFAWRQTLSDEEITTNCKQMPTDIYRTQCLIGAMAMRSTHWGEFKDFTNPVFCAALDFNDPQRCDAFIRDELAWLGDL